MIALFQVAKNFNWIPAFLAPVTMVEIVPSVRVDLVDLPKHTLQELKEAKEQDLLPTEEIKKAPTKIVEESTSEDLQFKKKKNFLETISKFKNSGEQKKETPTNDLDHIKKLVLAGNKLSKGTALVGKTTDQVSTEVISYVTSLPNFIRPFWKLPTYLHSQTLRCRIHIQLTSGGEIAKSKVIESSGVEEFDNLAQKALESASPFPVGPESAMELLRKNGVVLGFPL